MAVFGCLGPVVRAIGLPVTVTACLRAWISSLSLILFILLSGRRYTRQELKKVIPPMLVCGILLAGDWIGLFAAYNYTTIATATMCYYIVPILVLIASAVFLKERFTLKHGICAVIAFTGMILVSGVVETGIPGIDEVRGVLFSLLGAVSYAGVVIINKKYPTGDAMLRSTIQLAVAALLTTPYTLLTTDPGDVSFSLRSVLLLLLLGVVMTAATYILYFYLILKIPSRTVAIFAYADPVVAVIISVFFLSEPMSVYGLIGSLMIIGAAVTSET